MPGDAGHLRSCLCTPERSSNLYAARLGKVDAALAHGENLYAILLHTGICTGHWTICPAVNLCFAYHGASLLVDSTLLPRAKSHRPATTLG